MVCDNPFCDTIQLDASVEFGHKHEASKVTNWDDATSLVAKNTGTKGVKVTGLVFENDHLAPSIIQDELTCFSKAKKDICPNSDCFPSVTVDSNIEPRGCSIQINTPPTEVSSCPGSDCKNIGDTCTSGAGYTCCSADKNDCIDGSCWHANSEHTLKKGMCSILPSCSTCNKKVVWNINDESPVLEPNLIPLTFLGYDGCEIPEPLVVVKGIDGDVWHGCTESHPCDTCHGDCENDNGCIGDLKCMQRSSKEKVPGCKIGGQGDLSDYSYCYRPDGLTIKNGETEAYDYRSRQGPCVECTGDCDDDSQCKDGLICVERDGKDAVNGCGASGEGDVMSADYCVAKKMRMPELKYNGMDVCAPIPELVFKGFDGLTNKKALEMMPSSASDKWNGCTVDNPCETCQGDCETDSQCKGSLKCRQRSSKESVPGK